MDPPVNQAGKEAVREPQGETDLHRWGYSLSASYPDILLVQMRENTRSVYAATEWTAFHITDGIAEKDKPGGHRPVPGRAQTQREKPHQTPQIAGSRIPIRAFYSSGERKLPGFIQTVRVEQKNGAVVREYAGYDRLESLEEQALPAAVYKPLVPLLNFFMPPKAKPWRVPKRSRFTTSREARSSDSPKPSDCPGSTRIRSRPNAALYNPVELQRNVNKATLRLRQRLARSNRGNRNSFR
jgi:hypothetical protein